ncbi:MAG: polysaccharide deacetylase family protein [bacterium]
MRLTIILTAIMGGLAVSVSAETLQERLGFGPEDRLLIIHADDAGMCHSVNTATIHAMEQGVVSSASIMMPCSWVPEIVDYCREHPEADFGLHLTLNSEWGGYRWSSTAPRDAVSGLLDPMGYLWHDVRDTANHATPEQVKQEIRSQIETALAMGLKPTHLDTHMGTIFARKEYVEDTLALAQEFGIPFMMPDLTPEVLSRWGEREFISEEFIKRLRASGIPLLAGLYSSYEYEGDELTRKKYREIIQNLPAGVSQLIVHVGQESEELESITSSWRIRTTDYAIMIDPDTRKYVEDTGVKLIGWRDIQRVWTSGQ